MATKLELTWPGKNKPYGLEPRILIEKPELSYGDPNTENILIHGDNLLALKALEQEFSGKIKCIYIDPPYNTGNAFEFYDDGLEHSEWLNLMKPRLEALRNLLSDDGFFCCHIDDSEGHYLKIILDEIFGRDNYLTTLYIKVRYAEKTLKQDMNFHKEIEYIHVYRKKYGAKPNLNLAPVSFEKFNFYINEKGPGKDCVLGGKNVKIFQKDEYEIVKGEGSVDGLKEIWATGTLLDGNSSGRFFRDYLTGRYETDGYGVLYKVSGIGDDKFGYRYFTGPQKVGATKGKYFQGVPLNLIEDTGKQKASPINNFYDLSGSFGNCRTEGGVDFRSGKKPEALLQIILKHFSNEGDFVLDSFAGSGSTCATALKMNRKFIGIELGDHAYSHCVVRLKNVISGKDQAGITKSENWKGGGGYKFYELGPSILLKDKYDNYIINPNFNSSELVQAVCKIENFTYKAFIDNIKHGYSTEKDFIHVTTRHVTQDIIDDITESVLKEGESMLIVAKTYESQLELPENIQIKKIPFDILNKYEYNKDDYSLPINEKDIQDEE